MYSLEELTYFQKVAIEGQLSSLLSLATSDASALYAVYKVIKKAPTELSVCAVEVARNLLSIRSEDIDRILLEVSLDRFPTWLWVSKTIGDIKAGLATCCAEQAPTKVSFDRKLAKEKFITSAFVFFCRKVCLASRVLLKELLNSVLDDYELRFLHNTCHALLGSVNECSFGEELELTDALFDLKFVAKDSQTLDFIGEKKMIERVIEVEEGSSNIISKEEDKVAPSVRIIVSSTEGESFDKVKNLILSELEKMEKEINKEEEPVKEEAPKYVVSKAFKGNNAEPSVLRTFDTKEEAEKFVESMEKQFPELLATCEFIISKE